MASIVHLSTARRLRDEKRMVSTGLRFTGGDQPPPPDSPLLWRRTAYGAWLLARSAYLEALDLTGQAKPYHKNELRKSRVLVTELDRADGMLRAELAPNVHILPRRS